MTILNEIAQYTENRYKKIIASKPLAQVKAQALAMPRGDFEFKKALSKNELSFICEVKKASPSKGVIASDFPYLQIAKEYEKAGASAISCLTEPHWFLGADEYLAEIAANVSIPVLRKDFTVCDYQIYEAKVLGASAVLLICALLDTRQIEEYLKSYNNFIIESIDINNLKLIVSYLLSNNFDLDFVKSLLLENLEIFTYNFFYIKKNIDRIKLLNKNYIEII